jgi:hypothetical protein
MTGERIQKMCILCSKQFKVPKYRSIAKYCSKKCHTESGCLTRKGIKNSPETIQKICKARAKQVMPLGEKHPRWIKDRSKLKISDNRDNTQCRYWAYGVKKRDLGKCRMSNKDCKGQLEAHHILNWVEYPELRYDVNNGITLCLNHHPHGREKEKLMSPYFQELILENKNYVYNN